MIGKIKRLVQTVHENKRLLGALMAKQEEIEKFTLENYWANVFNSAIKGSGWMENISLNVGRWAANYSLFYVLFRILNEVKPHSILELGVGETTKMVQAYKMQVNPGALCVSVEHDSNWINRKKETGINDEHIKIVQARLEEANIHGKTTLRYKNLVHQLAAFGGPFQFVLIDGPFGSAHYSRYNIIDLLREGLLAEDFIVIMDDYNRPGEQETIAEFKKVLEGKNINFVEGVYRSDKSFVLLASPQFRYLVSL